MLLPFVVSFARTNVFHLEECMQRTTKTILTAALACAFIGSAFAQQVKPDRAIKYRQGILQAQGWNTEIMAAMVKGERPYNKDEFVTHAVYLEQLSHMAWDGFTPGSDQGAPTKAKPEIWTDNAKFKQAALNLQNETPKLVAAAKTGDMNQIKPAFSDVGKACKGCHDDFRAK
jgi:cytochrome c556